MTTAKTARTYGLVFVIAAISCITGLYSSLPGERKWDLYSLHRRKPLGDRVVDSNGL